MRNIYYQLWVDGIVNSKDYKNNKSSWKYTVYWILTIANGLNLASLVVWLKFYQIELYTLEINLFPNSLLENVIEGFLNYIALIAIINYFVVFYNNRYLKLIKKYPDYNGKLAFFYVVFSILLLLGTIICTEATL